MTNNFFAKVLQVTWTIREAAYLVNYQDPDISEIEISDTASDPVSRTFYWLTKEYQKGKLHPVKGSGDTARFSPGTLMRHLKENEHYVSEEVWKIYDHGHAQLAGSNVITETKKVYIDAAKLIWKQCPDYTASRVAKELEGLRSFFTNNILKPVDVDTIRKWLTGMGSNKPGRPKKNANTAEAKPDLTDIEKELGI